MSKQEEIASGVRDALHVLARIGDSLRRLEKEQSTMRATLDQLLLQQQKQAETIGLAALLEGELETEEERSQREKLEKEFEEFQAVMKRLEEV